MRERSYGDPKGLARTQGAPVPTDRGKKPNAEPRTVHVTSNHIAVGGETVCVEKPGVLVSLPALDEQKQGDVKIVADFDVRISGNGEMIEGSPFYEVPAELFVHFAWQGGQWVVVRALRGKAVASRPLGPVAPVRALPLSGSAVARPKVKG